jgi:hypothetical protein
MKFKILIFLLSFSFSFGQTNVKIDSSDISYSIKFMILQGSFKTINKDIINTIDSIINKTNRLEIKKIESKGFNNIDFYKVTYKSSNYKHKSEYIIGYNADGNTYFRLKGFLNNDFYYLFKFEVRIDSEYPANLISRKNKKDFLKNHYIEEIDLNCLVEHINSKEHWTIPCLTPINKILIDDYGEEHF